jgi:radical SAM-linked protein
MQQIVCRLAKGGPAKYVSHLDLMRAVERGARRAGLPLAHTEGFNPRPKIASASALAVGATSEAELLVIELAQPCDPLEVKDRLNASLPEGLRILQAWAHPAYKQKFAIGEMDIAEFRITVEGPVDPERLGRAVADFLEADEFAVARVKDEREKQVNIRPFVLALDVLERERGRAVLRLRVWLSPTGSARTEEVLQAIGIAPPGFRVAVHRTALYASGHSGKQAKQRLERMLPRRSAP